MPAFGRPASTTRNGRSAVSRRIQLPSRRRQLRQAARQPVQQVVAAHERNVLVGEVQRGLHVGQQVQQVLAQPLQRTRQAAGQLDQRPFQLALVAGLDDGLHRLGPRQVELAGQKRPHGEFARPRGASAGSQQRRRQEIEQRRTGERVNFDDVLAGVRVRRR